MFDVRIINNEAVLFEDGVEVMNLEHLRDVDNHILYVFHDGSYVRIYSNHDIVWYDGDDNGNREDDMPSYIATDGYLQYLKHGTTHRDNGPAIIHPDGSKEYWLDNIRYTKEEYDAEMEKRNA